MNLCIRSQDKLSLEEINKINITKYNGDVFNVVGNINILLGVYETKERALEVLDEIQEKIRFIQVPKNRYYCVYEMPQE